MTNTTLNSLDVAIKVELAMGQLYRAIGRRFPDHSSVWSRIAMEEMNHAALLRAAKDLIPFGVSPDEFRPQEMPRLVELLDLAERLISGQDDLSQEETYQKVLELEELVGEQGLQPSQQLGEGSAVNRIFGRLHHETDDHAAAIKMLLETLESAA